MLGDRKISARPHSKRTLQQRITQCDERFRDFHTRIEDLKTSSIETTASATKRIERAVQATEVHVMEMEPSVIHIEKLSQKTYTTSKEIQEQNRSMETHVQRFGNQIEEVRAAQDQIHVCMKEMLHGLLMNNEWQRRADERRTQVHQLGVERLAPDVELVRNITPSEAPAGAVREWLWRIMEADEEKMSADTRSMMRAAQGLDGSAYTQAAKLYRHPQFKSLLRSKESRALLVETETGEYSSERCSPMTLSCSLMLEELWQHQDAASIHYFCGMHNTSTDSLSGGKGMARSLVSQLLRLQEFNFHFLDAQWQDSLEQHELAFMCSLIQLLIRQLQYPVLYCIIDGITLLEGNRWKDEVVEVIWHLVRLVDETDLGTSFKLLVTGLAKSRHIVHLFQKTRSADSIRLRGEDADLDVTLRALRGEVARMSANM